MACFSIYHFVTQGTFQSSMSCFSICHFYHPTRDISVIYVLFLHLSLLPSHKGYFSHLWLFLHLEGYSSHICPVSSFGGTFKSSMALCSFVTLTVPQRTVRSFIACFFICRFMAQRTFQVIYGLFLHLSL